MQSREAHEKRRNMKCAVGFSFAETHASRRLTSAAHLSLPPFALTSILYLSIRVRDTFERRRPATRHQESDEGGRRVTPETRGSRQDGERERLLSSPTRLPSSSSSLVISLAPESASDCRETREERSRRSHTHTDRELLLSHAHVIQSHCFPSVFVVSSLVLIQRKSTRETRGQRTLSSSFPWHQTRRELLSPSTSLSCESVGVSSSSSFVGNLRRILFSSHAS